MISEALAKLVERKDLSREETRGVMEEIMSGQAHEAQIGAFLTALRMKGETVDELTGLAEVMLSKVVAVCPAHPFVVDTCGTGGDCSGTFNISTTAALVAAGAGVCIAKHGNRSVSSHSGSADLLEALGVSLELAPEQVAQCIDKIGIGFMYAPALHPAMKHVMPSRKAMGIRTVFNMLGPLTNPAKAPAQILGVYSGELTEVFAHILRNLGSKHALVVHGDSGLDELSITGPNKVSELKDGEIRSYSVEPEDFGLMRAPLRDLQGGDVSKNVEITQAVLEGREGPQRDIVVLNAGGAILVGGKARELAEGVELAKQSINSGAPRKKLESLVRLSQELASGC